MIYKIDWIEVKREGWAVATLIEGIENGKTFTDVSINKTSKDGSSIEWEKFDEFKPGMTLEGNMWRNPGTGKLALYPNRPAPKNDAELVARNTPPATGASRGFGGANKAMAIKAENIEKAQDNKTKGIMVAAAFRDATIMLTNLSAYSDMGFDDIQANHKAFVEWYIKHWNDTEDKVNMPY